MRIGASFPVGCCDKSCTLIHRLRRICALADIVCSGDTDDDLRTRDTDGRRWSNVRSLRIYLPSAALMISRRRSSGFYSRRAGSAQMQSRCARAPEVMTHAESAQMQSRF